jgi:hypothetical protein
MATIVLSAAGLALGGTIGGSVLGISGAMAGRAVGAMIGARIDQRLLGAGSAAVEAPGIDRLRLTSAAEGADVAQVFGRMRLGGQVIWASDFREITTRSGGGKGAPAAPAMTATSLRVSLALALCAGPVSHIGRIWADGVEIAATDLTLHLHHGDEDQLPDATISAHLGQGNVPAYRGTAYVVIEDMDLAPYGNRIPHLTFEVIRSGLSGGLADAVQGVALIPGTGEYALATTPVYLSPRFGAQQAVNLNSPQGGTDYTAAMDSLQGELPGCRSVLLVVSWFGDDLRCGHCRVRPKVEQTGMDAPAMPWRVSGITRSTAEVLPQLDGGPVYGGTPSDQSVVQAIRDQRARGLGTVFYPFILMDQLPGNALPDPVTGAAGQPALPWRGRITATSVGTAAAEVAAFMGRASTADFTLQGSRVTYTGPAGGGGYRRFILHYAHLCKAAGGVDAFCIGSEMRGLTQARDAAGHYPAVAALRALAADVRAILGPDCKISYAADWSEYHGHQPTGSGDKLFHLDPLWADPNIDFIGIDNYLPIADWRDGPDHADAAAGAPYDLAYLRANIAGGEYHDWFYPTPEARDAQRRVQITDDLGEPWIWRAKDLKSWWENPHHDRVNGQRAASPSPWVPGSKPIWFTEYGCAAIDKGANQPNRFLDPRSSEGGLPHYSNGQRDDLMQMQYLRAFAEHYADPVQNPVSALYGGPMVDMTRAHVWAWDARPYPVFPGNATLWADAGNYARGHWLNGRATNLPLAAVVTAICHAAGVVRIDTSQLYGVLRGYHLDRIGTGRAALQPLMLAYGFDALERDGVLVFRNRRGLRSHAICADDLARDPGNDESYRLTRAPDAELLARVELHFPDADADYTPAATEAVSDDPHAISVARQMLPLALTRPEARAIANRWLQESRSARDRLTLALPPSRNLGAGDVMDLALPDHRGHYRIDRVEQAGVQLIEATRITPTLYDQPLTEEPARQTAPFAPPVPVEFLLLDLPLLRGDELPHAPHLAVAGTPWPGAVAVYGAPQDADYALQDIIRRPATMGQILSPLAAGPVGIWDRQNLDLRLVAGDLQSVSPGAVLHGANLLAIGDGSTDLWEVVQFTKAEALGDHHFRLSGLLRGQAGTAGLMPAVWPAGSFAVLLDGAVDQLVLPPSARGVQRHFRYGPAKRPLGDASFRYHVAEIAGQGLRPYPVAHLRARAQASGHDLRWIRCSRIDGDLWGAGDVPLGEAREAYQIRILRDGILRRQVEVPSPHWHYPADQRAQDGAGGSVRVEVAQISDLYGAGLARALVLA